MMLPKHEHPLIEAALAQTYDPGLPRIRQAIYHALETHDTSGTGITADEAMQALGWEMVDDYEQRTLTLGLPAHCCVVRKKKRTDEGYPVITDCAGDRVILWNCPDHRINERRVEAMVYRESLPVQQVLIDQFGMILKNPEILVAVVLVDQLARAQLAQPQPPFNHRIMLTVGCDLFETPGVAP